MSDRQAQGPIILNSLPGPRIITMQRKPKTKKTRAEKAQKEAQIKKIPLVFSPPSSPNKFIHFQQPSSTESWMTEETSTEPRIQYLRTFS